MQSKSWRNSSINNVCILQVMIYHFTFFLSSISSSSIRSLLWVFFFFGGGGADANMRAWIMVFKILSAVRSGELDAPTDHTHTEANSSYSFHYHNLA